MHGININAKFTTFSFYGEPAPAICAPLVYWSPTDIGFVSVIKQTHIMDSEVSIASTERDDTDSILCGRRGLLSWHPPNCLSNWQWSSLFGNKTSRKWSRCSKCEEVYFQAPFAS